MSRMLSACLMLPATLAVLVSPMAQAEEVRGNYEVSLESSEGTHSVRTAEALGDDGVFLQALGPYTVTLRPRLEAGGSYTLEISVARDSAAPSAISTPVSRSFEGSLGGPLEFAGDFAGVSVSGVIFLRASDGAD